MKKESIIFYLMVIAIAFIIYKIYKTFKSKNLTT